MLNISIYTCIMFRIQTQGYPILYSCYRVSLYTGIVTVAAGFMGVACGTLLAQLVKKKHENGDALVCAVGLLMSTPFLFASMVVCQFNMPITWVCTSK